MDSALIDSNENQILIIEEDPMLGKVLVHSLENLGMDVSKTSEPELAMSLIEKKPPSLVIADIQDLNSSMDLLDEIGNQDQTELILLRSERLEDKLRSRLKPSEVIYKPFDTRFVCRRVLNLLSKKKKGDECS